MCKLLLQHDALPTLCDRIGLSPLHHTVLAHSPAVMAFLCEVLPSYVTDSERVTLSASFVKRWTDRHTQRCVSDRTNACVLCQ